MITNYNTYLKENKSFLSKLKQSLVDICNELNTELNKNNYFRVYHDSTNRFTVSINYLWVNIDIKENHLLLECNKLYKKVIIYEKDYKNIKEILK